MANTDNAIGFVPIRHAGGGQIRTSTYAIADQYDTAIGVGDYVEETGTGRNIAKSAAANTDNRGVFCGCSYIDVQGNPVYSEYWPAATETKNGVGAVALVWDDPAIVFRVQCDTLAAADVGALADWDSGTPNAATRKSGLELVASSTGTTGKSIKILGLSDIEGNEYGAHAKADTMCVEHVGVLGIGA